jgi:molybdopterin/thiamine biosynthesis adenylyltransferase
MVGCVQALEAIKLILGTGEPLVGRMMHSDTSRARYAS